MAKSASTDIEALKMMLLKNILVSECTELSSSKVFLGASRPSPRMIAGRRFSFKLISSGKGRRRRVYLAPQDVVASDGKTGMRTKRSSDWALRSHASRHHRQRGTSEHDKCVHSSQNNKDKTKNKRTTAPVDDLRELCPASFYA